MKQFTCRKLSVFVLDTAEALAERAAADFAAATRALLAGRDQINVVFAGAQSQMAFHAALRARDDIAWERINAVAVDEFHAPDIPAEYSVCAQPQRDLYSHVPLRSVNVLNHAAGDAEAERARYEQVVRRFPPHVACLGIGMSGHLAFNEPGDTDFNDPQLVRVMEVVGQSKEQLLTDPNFQALGTIPSRGITMSVPALMAAERIFTVVPYALKADAIRRFFQVDVTEDLPASIIKTHPAAALYLDAESFGQCGDLGLV